MNVCKMISCPWWNGDTKNYGCQRYSTSGACHLIEGRPYIRFDEYGLSAEALPDWEQLRRENNRYCLEDPMYQRAIEMAKRQEDWGQFKVGALVE